MLDHSVGELVKLYRARAGLSQEALAEKARVSARTIGDIETGFQRNPRLITVMMIAEALDLDERERAGVRASLQKRDETPSTSLTGVHGLPARRVTPVGRDAEIASLAAMLLREDVRLVTLVGPPGVGKTALAAALAQRLQTDGVGDIYWVELAVLSDPHDVPAALADRLNVREESGRRLEDAVLACIGERRRMLIFDNFEHVMDSAKFVGSLLEAAPSLKIVVTSRERLRLRAERAFTVRPLEPSAAVSLFVERARAVQSDFGQTDANAATLHAIVTRLEGLPLAIELAAPRLTLLPPPALIERLDARLPLLDRGPIDLPERQQTMRAAIAWSYDLLPTPEQQAFRRLAVFAGGATIDAAHALVTTDVRDDVPATLLQLSALVEKSLITLSETDDEPRLSMLEMLREFALERLAAANESHELQQAHAKYFAQYALVGEKELTRSDQGRWLTRMEREHANFRAALQWSIAGGDLETGMRLAGALWRFWWMRGHITEGLRWTERVLHAREARDVLVTAHAYAKTLQAKVALMNVAGDFVQALEPCTNAIAIWNELGDEAELAVSLNAMGIARFMLGEYDAARDCHERALALRRRIGDPFPIGVSLGSIAAVAQVQGDLDAAASACREAIALQRSIGSTSSISIMLTRLGWIEETRGNDEAARDFYDQGLAMQLEIDDRPNLAYSYAKIALLACKQGRLDDARRAYRKGFEIAHSLGNRSLIAEILEGVAQLLVKREDFKSAARVSGAAESLRVSLASPTLPQSRDAYLAAVATARSSLGSERFDSEYQRSTISSIEELVEETLA